MLAALYKLEMQLARDCARWGPHASNIKHPIENMTPRSLRPAVGSGPQQNQTTDSTPFHLIHSSTAPSINYVVHTYSRTRDSNMIANN